MASGFCFLIEKWFCHYDRLIKQRYHAYLSIWEPSCHCVTRDRCSFGYVFFQSGWHLLLTSSNNCSNCLFDFVWLVSLLLLKLASTVAVIFTVGGLRIAFRISCFQKSSHFLTCKIASGHGYCVAFYNSFCVAVYLVVTSGAKTLFFSEISRKKTN